MKTKAPAECICPRECDCAALDAGGFVSEFCAVHNRRPLPWVECKATIHHWENRP